MNRIVAYEQRVGLYSTLALSPLIVTLTEEEGE